MSKLYADYMDEISADELYEGLLAHGLFAEKLPPIFTSETFYANGAQLRTALRSKTAAMRSERMKELIPDDEERVQHILQKQVYGIAPTRIIYLIATNYILGFDDSLRTETKNFVQADAAEAAKEGRLGELVTKYFGGE